MFGTTTLAEVKAELIARLNQPRSAEEDAAGRQLEEELDRNLKKLGRELRDAKVQSRDRPCD
ncbi:MAG: hypothetical protein EXS16_16065 [Gemmataceae bacterium]|nr:hypothetical protein [Gemmataceae bacterium]